MDTKYPTYSKAKAQAHRVGVANSVYRTKWQETAPTARSVGGRPIAPIPHHGPGPGVTCYKVQFRSSAQSCLGRSSGHGEGEPDSPASLSVSRPTPRNKTTSYLSHVSAGSPQAALR